MPFTRAAAAEAAVLFGPPVLPGHPVEGSRRAGEPDEHLGGVFAQARRPAYGW